NLLRVLSGQECGVGAGDSHARGTITKGVRDTVVVPLGREVETPVRCGAVARQCNLVIANQRSNELRSGLVRLLYDATDERKRISGRSQHQLLALLQVQADADGNLGEAVQLLVEVEGGEGGIGECGRTHTLSLGGRAASCNSTHAVEPKR